MTSLLNATNEWRLDSRLARSRRQNRRFSRKTAQRLTAVATCRLDERLLTPQCGCQKLPESNVPIEEGAMLQDLAPARHSRHFLVQIESYASCASIRNLRTFVVTLSFEGTLF